MSNNRELFIGECRFTERTVEIKQHGHGIKLSIRSSPVKGDVVSVFLDAGETEDLVIALTADTGSDRTSELARVLGELANVIHRAGY